MLLLTLKDKFGNIHLSLYIWYASMKHLSIALLILMLSACGTVQKVQYSALEKVGVHKRDILVDRIEKTTVTQEQTKQQFQSAYEELASLINIKDQGLEKKYKSMSKAVAASESKSSELKNRIEAVDEVAKALFKEWETELNQYQSENLKRVSASNLAQTKNRYGKIYQKMQESHQRVIPVLQVLQDNTLYLKHNLNARAVASLSSEVLVIEDKVKALIAQMEASIDESKAFIDSMQG